MTQMKANRRNIHHIQILREQDVTHLKGHIVWLVHSIARITGNCPKTGFVEFNNNIKGWIGFSHLRDAVDIVDITNLTTRQALKKIKEAYPSSTRHLRCNHIDIQLSRLTEANKD